MSAEKKPAKPTLDQVRAKYAWEAVARVKAAGNSSQARQFGNQAKRLPVRILTAGLGPALAFLTAKNYAPELLEAIGSWIEYRIPSHPAGSRTTASGPRAPSLLDRIVHGDSQFLRRATDETLIYLQWLVRFAEAEGLADDGSDS